MGPSRRICGMFLSVQGGPHVSSVRDRARHLRRSRCFCPDHRQYLRKDHRLQRRRDSRRHRGSEKPCASGNAHGDQRCRRYVSIPSAAAGNVHRDVPNGPMATGVRKTSRCRLAKTRLVDAIMRPVASAEISVSATAPVLDTNSTTLGTNLNTRAIETLPSGRNYASVVQVTPGVSSDANPGNPDQSTISVYGSSGAENSFFIDGVNTTNVEYGFQGKELNFEFISEVDVKTGGYEAEYGRSTGGIINVITKSGGNEFTGDLFGYNDTNSLQASRKSVVSTAGSQKSFKRQDFGLDLGGYILRDKLWFFGAVDRVNNSIDSALPSGPNAGTIVTSKSRRNLGSGKLTFNVAAESLADRDVPSGPARRYRRDQRRESHAQRRSQHVPRPPGFRRSRLRPALRRVVRIELGRHGPGRATQGKQFRRTGNSSRRSDRISRRRQRLRADRRLRSDPEQEFRSQALRRFRAASLPRTRAQSGHRLRNGEGPGPEADVRWSTS